MCVRKKYIQMHGTNARKNRRNQNQGMECARTRERETGREKGKGEIKMDGKWMLYMQMQSYENPENNNREVIIRRATEK